MRIVRHPELRAKLFRQVVSESWIQSHMDEEGYSVISDRKKQMINVGRLKAYPREIEDMFYEHPKVKMVAAIGVPRGDDPGNEFVKAFIVLKDGVQATPEEFIKWAREKMAGYKRPRGVEFRDSLPLSQVGKVLQSAQRGGTREKRNRIRAGERSSGT